VKECVLHIKLMDGPILRVSQGEDSANSSGLHNGAECLIVIDAGTLSEPAKNPASLIPVQGAISMKLVLENPLPGDHICLGRPGNKFPSVIVQEGSMFFHGPAPVRIGESITAGAR
jgi:hypothetical protein